MTQRCIAPGEVGPDNPGSYIVITRPPDNVEFYHVDSCLAVAFILEGNIFIGGHVGMMWPPSDDLAPHANVVRMIQEMQIHRGNRKVDRLIIVGPSPTWVDGMIDNQDSVGWVRGNIQVANSLYCDSDGIAGGVDVWLEKNGVKILKYDGKEQVFQRGYSQILGGQDERL